MAVCVAMVMLAAGIGRDVSGRWRGQTDSHADIHLPHTHTYTYGNASRHVGHCLCGSDDMVSSTNQQCDRFFLSDLSHC